MNLASRIPVILTILALWSCQSSDSNEQAPVESKLQEVPEEEKLPDFTLKALTGETVNLRSFEGEKIVIVNFWATWCGPCRIEIPDFNRVYEKYREREVEFLGISLDHSPEEQVSHFMQQIPIAYPVLAGSPELGMQYRIRGLPTTFVIDRNGRVVQKFVGLVHAQQLENEIKRLL